MSTPYIPAADADYDAWAQNFSSVITASPATYGLLAADATAIANSYNTWHTAYALLLNPATKTSPNVAAKDVQKASSLVVLRTYAQIIQSNAGVSNMAKSAAGLTVRATGRTPIPAPGTVPILGFVGQQVGVATLNYKDASTPTSKAKPFGAIQMEIWYQVPATGASPDVTAASFYGVATKTPFVFDTPDGDKGKSLAIWGRWITRTGLIGPWSTVLQITAT